MQLSYNLAHLRLDFVSERDATKEYYPASVTFPKINVFIIHKGGRMNKRLLASLITLFSMNLLAQETPVVDQRQENQEKRIEQGVQSGEINKREERRLKRQQERIEKAEDRAKADGTVTNEEKRQLKRMQNRASRNIHHQKHDGQKRHK